MSTGTCIPHHDVFTNVLTGGLCIGLVISYLPQHLRIILSGSSEGFSPWFLLLGSTSAATGLLNIVVKQWDIVKCCRVLSAGNCIEGTAGIFQLFLQWICFTTILVLYMIYYPPHLKYATVDIDFHDNEPPHHVKTTVKQDAWRLSVILSWVVLFSTAFFMFVTFLLLAVDSTSTPTEQSAQLTLWATFLGVTSTLLSAFQYLPQIVHTYRHKLVGALSIGTMLIQTPGAVLMVTSIALRPGTNWTTWSPNAVAGVLQGALLVMCLLWKSRQHKLGIDDFGNPLGVEGSEQDFPAPTPNSERVQDAVFAVVETDVREEPAATSGDHEDGADEETPLLKRTPSKNAGSWFGWLRR